MFVGYIIDVMVGISWMREYYRIMGIGFGFIDLGGFNIIIFNGKGDIISEEYNLVLFFFFVCLNYDYKECYFVFVSICSDKFFKFVKGNRVGYFFLVLVGWNIYEENFFNIEWISKMKIRVSYGELGVNFIDLYFFFFMVYGLIFFVFGENQIG